MEGVKLVPPPQLNSDHAMLFIGPPVSENQRVLKKKVGPKVIFSRSKVKNGHFSKFFEYSLVAYQKMRMDETNSMV